MAEEGKEEETKEAASSGSRPALNRSLTRLGTTRSVRNPAAMKPMEGPSTMFGFRLLCEHEQVSPKIM